MSASTSLRIAYDDLGSGGPALLFLPGWCGGREVFADLLGPAARARRVISLDWRGHGQSDQPAEDFGSAELVDDAVSLIDQLGVDAVVPVALSHAGWVAIELRRQLGSARVPGIALLDWMVLGPPPGFLDALGALQDPEAWEAVRGGLFSMWTEGVDVRALHEYVASMGGYGFAAWARAGREIAAQFASEPTPLEALARLAPPCPTIHLYAQPRDDGFLAAQQAFARQHPWFSVHRLDARSHFPMFEAPHAMVAVLEQFATGLGG